MGLAQARPNKQLIPYLICITSLLTPCVNWNSSLDSFLIATTRPSLKNNKTRITHYSQSIVQNHSLYAGLGKQLAPVSVRYRSTLTAALSSAVVLSTQVFHVTKAHHTAHETYSIKENDNRVKVQC